ncbi:MAG: radical SAM protein [Candidatus Stygibacter australis]|nr:radical SAM protein [Candidatus Stygibacter australis]MDP8321576.1 radical SAM protein [Candidatus Stygibacter australis]
MPIGNVFAIKRFSVHDGPGIRTTVFFMGCPLRCRWCHNPESWSAEPFTYKKKITLSNGSELEKLETLGNQKTVEELGIELLKDIEFYKQSGGGITFSGGEPLSQPDFLYECLQFCRDNNLTTALDTSGYWDWNDIEKLLELIDFILYDIKGLSNHNKYTGVDNELILDNLRKLQKAGATIQVRIPLIEEVNGKDIDDIITILQSIGIEKVALLPYHDLAKHKAERFSLRENSESFSCSAEFLKASITKFEKAGFTVQSGG